MVWMLALNNLTYWNLREMPLFLHALWKAELHKLFKLEKQWTLIGLVLQCCHNCFHLWIPTDSFAWSVCLLLLLSSTLFACVLVCVTLYIHVGEEAVQFWHWFYAKPFDFLQTTNSELWILYILWWLSVPLPESLQTWCGSQMLVNFSSLHSCRNGLC